MAKELAPWEMEWAAPSDPLTEAVNRSAATVEVAPKAPKSFPLGEKNLNVKRKRTQKWDQYIDIFASEYPDLPDLGNLAKAAMLQESGGHVKATSTVNGKPGARGLMQVMPKTWEGMGRDPSKIYDPIENIAGGVQYLAEQYRAFGDRRLAMAAYNAGPGNVRKAGNRVPDIEETKAYVDAVEGYYGVLAGTDTPPWELPWATPGQEKPGVGMGDVKLAESQATPLPATVRKFVAHPFGGGTYTVPAPTEKELALEAQKEADIARGEDVRQRQRDAPEGAFLTTERIGREKFRPPPGEMVETLMPPSGPGGEMYTLKAPRGDNPMEAIGAAMSGMTQDNTGFLADVIRGKGHTQRLGERVRLAEEEAGRQAKYATPEGKALLASAQKKAEKMQKMSVDEEEALAENPDFAQQMEDFAGAVKDDFPQFAKDLAAQIIEDGPFLVLASRGAHSVLRAMSKAGSAYRAGAIARRAESLAKNPAALEARLAARGPTAAPTALETIARAKRVGAAVEAERVSTQALGKTPIIARVGEESAEDIAALAAVQYPKEAAAGRKYGGIELTRDVILGTFGGVAIGAFRRSIDTRVSRKTAAGARKVAYLTGAENHPAIQEMLPQFAALAENPEVAGVRFKIDAGEQKHEFWDRARLDAADYKDRPEGWYIKAGEAGKGKAIILRKSAGQETVVEETAHFIQDQLRKRVKEDVEGDGPYSRLAEQIKDWEGKIREAAKEKGVSVPEGDVLFAQTFAAHMGYADKFPQSVRRIVIPDGILLGFRRLMSEDPAIRGESFQAGDLRQAEAVPRTGEKGDALARAEDAYFADRKQGDEAEIARAEFEYDQSIRAYLGMEASTADIPARRRPLPNDEPVPAAPEQSATPAATPVKPSKPVAPAKPGKPAKQAEPVKQPVKPVETAEAPRERPNRAAGVSFRKFREVQGYLSKKDSKTGKKIPPSDSEVLQYLRELGDEPVPEKTRRVHSSKMGNAPREARSREIGILNHVLRDGDEGFQTEVMKGAYLPPQFETAFVKLTKVETHDKRMIRYKDGKGATYDFKADEDIHVGGNHEYGIKPWDEANPPFQLKESPKPSELQKRTTERFRGYVESIKAKPWEMNWPVAPTSEDIARSIELTDRRGQTRFQLKPSEDKNVSAPVFYSKLERTVESKMPNAATPEAIRGMLKGAGVKDEEIKWTDLEGFLAGKEKVSKADVLKHLEENQVEIREVTKGQSDNRTAEAITQEKFPDKWDRGYRYVVNGETSGKKFFKSEAEAEKWINSEENTETKFSSYQEPGGKNYRELLLTLPLKEKFDPSKVEIIRNRGSMTQGTVTLKYDGNDLGTWDDTGKIENQWMRPESELIVMARKLWSDGSERYKIKQLSGAYKSSHFNEPNVLAHVRFNERSTPDGKKVLHLEEVQSDWHQRARKEGYKNIEPTLRSGYKIKRLEDIGWTADDAENIGAVPNDKVIVDGDNDLVVEIAYGGALSDDDVIRQFASDAEDAGIEDAIAVNKTGVPDAPFKKTWHELALRRMLRYAAENGYDYVSWTGGEKQAARYDLSKHVDVVHATKNDDGTFMLKVQKGGNVLAKYEDLDSRSLSEYVG